MFYLDLFRELEKKKVRYMVVGGLAMNLHGVPRSTMDVDIVIALDDENVQAFLGAARELNLKPVAPVLLEDLTNPAVRRSWIKEKSMVAFGLRPPEPSAPTIDVLIDTPVDVAAALKRAKPLIVENARVLVASITDLISLKERTGRAQDRADIEHLKRLVGKD